jgi:hypothetical protein
VIICGAEARAAFDLEFFHAPPLAGSLEHTIERQSLRLEQLYLRKKSLHKAGPSGRLGQCDALTQLCQKLEIDTHFRSDYVNTVIFYVSTRAQIDVCREELNKIQNASQVLEANDVVEKWYKCESISVCHRASRWLKSISL